MTEREKMLAGQLYDPSDEELSHLRKRAFQLVERFNRLQKRMPQPSGKSCRHFWAVWAIM